MDQIRKTLRQIQENCSEFENVLQRLEGCEACDQLQHLLMEVTTWDFNKRKNKPRVIALVGPTGAGKSTLFNALTGKENASKVSVVRAFTKNAHVAYGPSNAGFVENHFASVGETRDVKCENLNVVLVDTPDMNSDNKGNAQTANQIVKLADVVVFSCCAEQYSGRDLSLMIEANKLKKRCLFVLTKMDLITEGDRQTVEEEFQGELVQKGFKQAAAQSSCVYSISAMKRDSGLERLQEELLLSDTNVEVMNEDAFIGQVESTLNSEKFKDIEELHDKLRKDRSELSKQLLIAMQEALSQKEYQVRLQNTIRVRTYQLLPTLYHAPISLCLRLRAKIAVYIAGFYSLRLFTRGGIWSLFKVAQSTKAALQGRLESNSILRDLENTNVVRERLESQRKTVKTKIRQFGFKSFLDKPVVYRNKRMQSQVITEHGSPSTLLGDLLSKLVQAPSDQSRHAFAQLSASLEKLLDEASADVARRTPRFFHKVLNVIPLVALGHFAYIVINSWFREEWLPGQIYLHFLALLSISLLPVYAAVNMTLRQNLNKQTLVNNLQKLIKDRRSLNGLIDDLYIVDLDELLADLKDASNRFGELRQMVRKERKRIDSTRGILGVKALI